MKPWFARRTGRPWAWPSAAVQRRLGWLLLLLLALPWMRQALESRMGLHMLVQLPALMLCGFLMAAKPSHGAQTLSPAAGAGVKVFNAHGITGLCWVAVVLGLSMVPRVLDLAAGVLWVDACKYLLVVLCGMAWRRSWRAAGLVLQAFFLGNVLPMMAVVGFLYQEANWRVCNAYGLADQQRTGELMVASAAVLGLLWLLGTARKLVQNETGATSVRALQGWHQPSGR